MNLRGIAAILLFSLTIPVVMGYRILPIEGTPYWLFGVLFLSLLAFSVFSLFPEVLKKNTDTVRTVLLWVSILITLGGVTVTAIADRHRIAPVWGVHDIILQQEQAIRFLVTGKNPYKETYFGTPVEMFRYDEQGKPATNPALYHFVMPPWYLLFPLPFYWVANQLFGYFDGRMVLIILMAGTLLFVSRWFKNKSLAEVAVILTALSPATVQYVIEGRSDAFALFWLVGALFFLERRRYLFSAILFGLGLISKQTVWFAFPLYAGLLWWNIHTSKIHKGEKSTSMYGISELFEELKGSVISETRIPQGRMRRVHAGDRMKVLIYMSISLIIAGVFILPFFLWDARAYIQSTVLYLSAGGETGYPVSGYGLSMILYQLGIIKGLHDAFPFLLLQCLFGIPTLLLSLAIVRKNPTVPRFFITFAVTLFAFWYTSRYFNNSHVSVIATLFTLGILKQYDEEKHLD